MCIPKKPIPILLFSFLLCSPLLGQKYENDHPEQTRTAFHWPEGIEMAISLTFDDARLSQIDKGIPILNSFGVKATFYVNPDGMLKRVDGWKEAVSNGHDIGNHSVKHPCSCNYYWSKENALEDYTLSRMSMDGKSFENILKLIEEARENGSWLILAGHEMDNSGSHTSLLSTIESLCRYASDPENGIWIDHVTNVGRYVRTQRDLLK